ncbi:S8 family serine peptidase [Streptomyces sp. PA03-5A]|nr:S8 family serine peptidase [Streptomyces sp. PA03-5A]
MAWTRLTAAISAGLMVATGGVQAAAASGTDASGTAARPAAVPKPHSATVRLVTGDRVTVTTLPGGRRTASVQPAPGREHMPFKTLEGDDKAALTVMPFDAETLVAAGTLDRRLFDVTALIADGYDVTHTSALPLIVSSLPEPSRAGARATAQASKAAAATADRLVSLNSDKAPSRSLESIGARSVRIADRDLGTFWNTLNSGGTSDAARAAVTPRIALDGKVKAVLDRSTAQINAPAAWKAGYEGQGVKVAVLDTGVDSEHPDLADRIAGAKDFSGSANTEDHFGHGTHVASTVAGTGAASSGTRRGVAPKADLLIGKVLDDNGYGSESGVIAGMEWAAGEDVKVVNMSLGADMETDGTDPMSLALNALTASTDTLFVVAAGNAGPSPSSVGSPGAADAALTVGAVDRDDSLASFSSRGPRDGDGAAKPDVTAPGVGIVAARAAGTTLGTPVDAYYVALDGTSMATPHVAGAAALLAQQHPGWSAQQLKDALISTSHTVPGTGVTEQGGGRIDLAAATGPVTATGTVTLPSLQADDTGRSRQAATVRYSNTGDRPISLTLGVSLATTSGRALPDGVVAVGSGTVQVAPGATAEVPLRTDAARAVRGKYYGYLTARAADGTVVGHTTVSLVVHAPRHLLTVVYRDRTGRIVPGAAPTIWGADGVVDYTDRETGVALVEEGTYQLSYDFYDAAENGVAEYGDVVVPEVKVGKDTTVTLSAVKATEVSFRTPRPAKRYGIISPTYYREIDGHSRTAGLIVWPGDRYLTSPTAPVTDGAFEFTLRAQLAAPQVEAEVSGRPLGLTPVYEPYSPPLGDQGARLTAVYAGTAQAPAFRGVRGKLAVVQDDNSGGYDTYLLARAAADAGAKALLVVWAESLNPTADWRPIGDRLALPYVRASWTEGTALLKRMAKDTTTVTLSGTVVSPYMYDLVIAKSAVPEHPVFEVSEHDSARVRATYTRTGASAWATEQRFGWRPYQDTAWNQWSRFVPVGRDRVEYVTAGDTQWQHAVAYGPVDDLGSPLQGGMRDDAHTYRPGQQATERWYGAVVRPSIPRGGHLPSVRTGNTLAVYVPEFNDSSDTVHWSFAQTGGFDTIGDTAVAELYRNGQRIASSERGAWGNFEVPAGDAAYRLDLATTRTADNWRFGTGTRTSWSFRSAAADADALLPLLQVDYDVRADAFNALGPQRRHTIELTVRMQDGMAAPRGVSLKAEASYDDGRTWTKAVTTRKGSVFSATVERPLRVRGDAYVTLRVTATDAAGNSVRQTVDRAYLHHGTA